MSQSVGWSISWSVYQSVTFYFEIPGSIPGESKRNLWCMKWHWDKFSLST